MSDDVNYQDSWQDESTQCKNCKSYQVKEDKHACVPEDMTFEQAIEKYGEVNPNGHCNYFEPKK